MENTLHHFAELKISPELKKGIEELGYLTPTDFQRGVFENFTHGKNVLGEGQSSYGKSLAFSLPILSKIDPTLPQLQALILCETALLGDLCAKECKALGRHLNIVVSNSLASHPHILVGGVDDIMKSSMDLPASIHTIFFDGLSHDKMVVALKKFSDVIERGVQVLVFGKEAIDTCKSNEALFSDAIVISNNDQPKIVPQTIHIFHQAKDTEPKPRALLATLLLHKPKFALVTVNEGQDADFLARYLQRYGFRTQVVTEDSQKSALADLLEQGLLGAHDVLICQNTLLPGLALDRVGFMINYDMFDRPQAYEQATQFSKQASGIHRSVVNIVTPRELGVLGPIKAHCLIEMKEQPLPNEEEVLDLGIGRIIENLLGEAKDVELSQFTEIAEKFLQHKDAGAALSFLLKNYLSKAKESQPHRRDNEYRERRHSRMQERRPHRERGQEVRERPQVAPAEEASDGISRLYVTLGRRDGFLDLTALAQYISDTTKVDLGHFSGGGMIRDTSAHIEVDDDVAEEIIKTLHQSKKPNAQSEADGLVVCERAKGPRESHHHHRYPRRRPNFNRR